METDDDFRKTQAPFDESRASIELERLVEKLKAPKTVFDDALEIYKKAVESGLFVRCSTIVLASLYASCRKNKFLVTMKELGHLDQSSRKVNWREIARCYGRLLSEMKVDVKIPDPYQYLEKIGLQSHISDTALHLSYHIVRKARDEGVSTCGKDPRSVAAAALYTACQDVRESAREKDLADVAGVTEQTLRRNLRSFRVR